MRRAVSILLASLALAGAVALGVVGFVCGAREVSEPCFSTEECTAASRCVSHVHPLTGVFVGLASVAVLSAWMRASLPSLGVGLVGFGLGILSEFSLGIWGVGLALLLLAAGWVTPGASPNLRWAAAAAVAATVALFFLFVITSAGTIALAWVAALGPAIVWIGFAAVESWRSAKLPPTT